jgi:hypothetical protein
MRGSETHYLMERIPITIRLMQGLPPRHSLKEIAQASPPLRPSTVAITAEGGVILPPGDGRC